MIRKERTASQPREIRQQPEEAPEDKTGCRVRQFRGPGFAEKRNPVFAFVIYVPFCLVSSPYFADRPPAKNAINPMNSQKSRLIAPNPAPKLRQQAPIPMASVRARGPLVRGWCVVFRATHKWQNQQKPVEFLKNPT